MSDKESIEGNNNDKAAEFYANANWLRTAIVGASGIAGIFNPVVPAFVGALDVAITSKAQQIAQRRLDELCLAYEQEMDKISAASVDKDYIESEAFFDLVFQAWEATKRTRHNEKIRLYAKVLVGSVPQQDREQHEPEDYLNVLSSMSYREFYLASAMYEQQKERPLPDEDTYAWMHRIGACHEFEYEYEHGVGGNKSMEKTTRWTQPAGSWPQEEFDFLIMRLQGFGLARRVTEYPLWSSYSGYIITESYRKMMEFLYRNQ